MIPVITSISVIKPAIVESDATLAARWEGLRVAAETATATDDVGDEVIDAMMIMEDEVAAIRPTSLEGCLLQLEVALEMLHRSGDEASALAQHLRNALSFLRAS